MGETEAWIAHRERERETETDRDRETETDRQTDKERGVRGARGCMHDDLRSVIIYSRLTGR